MFRLVPVGPETRAALGEMAGQMRAEGRAVYAELLERLCAEWDAEVVEQPELLPGEEEAWR